MASFTPTISPDAIPVPVTRCEGGYKPQWQYRTEDAYVWREGRRAWRLRFTDARGVDAFTDHPTLRHARQYLTGLLGLDLTPA